MALIVKGKGTRLVQALQKDVRNTLRASAGAAVFKLLVDSESREVQVVVKDVQRDSISRGIIHLTLQEVKDDDIIRIMVPVEFHGEPDCVNKKRSSLMTPMMNLEVYAKPADIPDHIHVDISAMTDNDKIVVGDLQLPAGVSTHLPADALIATTFHMRAVSLDVPTTAEAAAVPEAGAEGEVKEGEPAAAGAAAAAPEKAKAPEKGKDKK